jgi:predicted nucleic acid-binding protein
MRKIRIYLDNCCFSRPYDTQTQTRIILETSAKLYIQELISSGKIEIVWSYVLKYEISKNLVESQRRTIAKWEKFNVQFVGKSAEVETLAKEIQKTGIKPFDSLHLACAITANCDYLITVDKRMTQYKDQRIIVCNPLDFINREMLIKESNND